MIDVLGHFDADDYAQQMVRAVTWERARYQAAQLVALLSTMKAYQVELPAWCRGARAVRA